MQIYLIQYIWNSCGIARQVLFLEDKDKEGLYLHPLTGYRDLTAMDLSHRRAVQGAIECIRECSRGGMAPDVCVCHPAQKCSNVSQCYYTLGGNVQRLPMYFCIFIFVELLFLVFAFLVFVLFCICCIVMGGAYTGRKCANRRLQRLLMLHTEHFVIYILSMD